MNVELSQLTVKIGARTLVRDLSGRFESGQCWAIIGRNGAGKSTLLRTLAGLRPGEEGHLALDGKRLSDWSLPDLARARAYLPQNRADAFSCRAIDAVLTARHPYQAGRYWDDANDRAVAWHWLEVLEVSHLAERDLTTLSGGERQRVAIAGLFAQETPLVLLDEPTTALDLAHQVQTMLLIARLSREMHQTAILIGHDLNLIRLAASHALLLMGDGTWAAGPAEGMMRTDLLSSCLGHPLEVLQHNGHTVFVHCEEGF